jgi:riboflavin kinase/FMN adenylyltransferase
MQIYEYPLRNGQAPKKCVLALGFFDGVHIAHRKLLLEARKIANERGLEFGIFTFKSTGEIKSNSLKLYDDKDKAEFFDILGADFTVFADFSCISHNSAEEFVKNILIDELSCMVCVAGFNFRFGKGASAGNKELSTLMQSYGGEAYICNEITADDGRTLSATLIRELICKGQIEEANRLLGSPYYIKGRVLHGRADGRRLGFPTANISIAEGEVIPTLGVYRSAVVIDGKIFSGVTNIGKCPTFNDGTIHLETHIIDFAENIYDKEIRVYLLGFLREERPFGSIDELIDQINKDKNTTITENGELTWQDLGLK